MRLRALPPAGVPISAGELLAGLAATRRGEAALTEFRSDIRRRFGVRHQFLASSGRAALSLLLQALHELSPDRDVVALPAYTSFSVPSAVVNAGLKVALYDLDPVTLSPDPAGLAGAVDRQTLAVMGCHLFGYPADLDLLRSVAHGVGAALVDDAAQAMGADFRGKAVGTCGDAGLFSLSRGKNINAVDGGIIVTDRDDLAAVLGRTQLADPSGGTGALLLKAFLLSALMHPSLYWLPRSLPFLRIGASCFDPVFSTSPFTTFQAGIARRMLARLPAITAGRRDVADCLSHLLEGAPHAATPLPVFGSAPVYLRLPVIMGEGEEVREAPLLGVVRSYPAPLDALPALQPYLHGAPGSFPGARHLAERLLTAPTHQFVDDRERCLIAEHLAQRNPRR